MPKPQQKTLDAEHLRHLRDALTELVKATNANIETILDVAREAGVPKHYDIDSLNSEAMRRLAQVDAIFEGLLSEDESE